MTYTPSKYWIWLNERIKEMLDKLGGYENFKRTAGYIYNNDYLSSTTGEPRKVYNLDCTTLWQFLYQNSGVPKGLLDSFEEPLEGNPMSGNLDGRHVTIDLGCSILEYWNLSQYIDFNKINTIYEIGGGYGRTAYVITKIYPSIKYILYDLESSLEIASRYLTSVAPWGKFEFRTPDKLEGSCDLSIAINCMAEMTKQQVDSYFDFIDRNSSYFYFVTWLKSFCEKDNIIWELKDYPVKKNWEILFSKPYVRLGWVEQLYKL